MNFDPWLQQWLNQNNIAYSNDGLRLIAKIAFTDCLLVMRPEHNRLYCDVVNDVGEIVSTVWVETPAELRHHYLHSKAVLLGLGCYDL